MKLRTRLIVAFLLLSVVPLGAVTLYSYVANARALQVAATRETDELDGELSQRMQLVTMQLSQRVEQLMDVSALIGVATVPGLPQARPGSGPVSGSAIDPNLLTGQAAGALGEAAMLLETVEVRVLRGPLGGRGRRDEQRSTQPGTSPTGRGALPRGAPQTTSETSASPGVPAHGASRTGRGMVPAAPNAPGTSGAPVSRDESARIEVDLGPIRLDLFRQIVPEGTSPSAMTPEERQRVGLAISQRMLGIVEGIKLGATELQRKAEEAGRKAEAEANAKANVKAEQAHSAAAGIKPPQTATGAMRRTSALSGTRLDVTVEENGQVVRTANAEINLPNVLMTVFTSVSRGQGEVPFAVGTDGHIYTQTEANRATVDRLAPASLPDGASTAGRGDWIVVMTRDPTGSGLRLGIARPFGDFLNELRRTAGRNAAFGLLFIAFAIVGIVPLSGRLTRNLSTLTGSVRRIADGDYGTRVSVTTHDEIGELARAFNQMAADVERHQRTAVEQERIKRELELGRQIQHDMLPREPLRVGLTEIEGTSVPAREVGGDFFNYFVVPGGHVVLLVGDVSGRGVGAALLMANIQASLHTRLALGQDLSAVVDAIDQDVGLNSPGDMYATLFLSILDPATRTLRYVSAGHNPQYVLRARGGLEHTDPSGLPVGMLSGHGYDEHRVQLAAGDLLFLYTDGCVETENDAEDMFGADRLEALLTGCRAEQPHSVLQRVAGALSEFRGTRELLDDATMMAVKIG